MSHLRPAPPSKGRIILIVLAFIVFGFYCISLFFYHDAVLVAVPLVFLFLASTNLYQGIGKLRRLNDVKWYKHYNIMLSFAWLSGFAVFSFSFLLPDNYGAAQTIIVGLFFVIMIAFLVYAFFLYKRNDIRNDGHPQE